MILLVLALKEHSLENETPNRKFITVVDDSVMEIIVLCVSIWWLRGQVSISFPEGRPELSPEGLGRRQRRKVKYH